MPRPCGPADPRYYELGLNLFHASALARRSSRTVAATRWCPLDAATSAISRSSARTISASRTTPTASRASTTSFSDATRGCVRDARVERHDRRAASGRAAAARARSIATSTRGRRSITIGPTRAVDARHRVVHRPGKRAPAARSTSPACARRACATSACFTSSACAWRTASTPASLEHRFGAEVRRLWGDYDYSSEVHVLPGFPFPGSPGIRHARARRAVAGGLRDFGYWDVRARARRALDAAGRHAHRHADVRRLRRRRAMESATRACSIRCRRRRTCARAGAASSSRRASTSCRSRTASTRSIRRSTRIMRSSSVDHAFAAGLDLRVEAYRKYYRRINPRFENLFDPLVLLPEAEFDRVRIAPDSARATAWRCCCDCGRTARGAAG